MRGIRGTIAGFGRPPEPAVLRTLVVTVAAAQALVLGLLARRGSWLSDDLDFLVQGGRGFAPDELLTPLNDHIAPGLRLVYAGFAQLAPLNWDVTVAWRVLLQAVAIALFGLLLRRLLGSSWWVPAGTVLYASSPLSMPSFMSLSSGVNNLPAHVFGLLVLHATLDWYAGHRRRAVAYGPLSLLASLACWEKSGLILLTALALALYVREQPAGRWLRATWPFAAALTAPLVAFGILYGNYGRPSGGDLPGPGTMLRLAGRSFAVPLGALAGGPWHWSPLGPFGLADAPAIAVVVGGLAAAVLVLTAWRKDRRALLLWGAVAVYTTATLLVVAYGRYEVFGPAFTVHYHYWSDMSVPLTLAVVLTARSLRPRPALRRLAPPAAACCLLAWIAGAATSYATFAGRWDDNPARPYFDSLRADLETAGPSVNLWDTRLPGTLSNVLVDDARLSPVLRTAGLQFQLQASSSEPRIVDDSGHLRPARLAPWSRIELPPKGDKFCALHVQGATSMTLPLRWTTAERPAAGWFGKLSSLSNRENTATVELIGPDGEAVGLPGPAGRWPAGLANVYLGPSASVTPVAVRLRTTDPAANLCVGSLEIGLPQVSG